MQEQPNSIELLEAVTAFFREEALPNLEGRLAFLARVAANAVGIVKRQLEQEAEADAEAGAQLEKLLGHDGDLTQLNEELCDRIERGEFTVSTPGLVEHLWDTTLRKVAIDQPKYSGYRRALQQREEL